MAATKKRGLGRGLDALLATPETDSGGADESALQMLAITAIRPGTWQPRRHFDETTLEELAASIRAQGLLQPVVVRARGRGQYELIAGERRWRAAQRAGLRELPALVREVPEASVLALALIENIQRQDLSALEEAQALRRLLDEFGLTHQQVAEAVGRSRAAVSNLLRLLELPAPVLALLEAGTLEMGHARALAALSAPRAIALAERAAQEGWSVRQLEAAARASEATPATPAARETPRKPRRDADLAKLERELAEHLATRVQVQAGRGGRGKLVLHYHSLDALDGLLARLRR